MLKEAVASKAAKLLMTCVCPVAGTTALTLGVPQVRDAVHKAVQPRQYAKPKTRVRQLEEPVQVASAEDCPALTPLAIADVPFQARSASLATGPSQLAEVPQLEAGVPLTPRIFIPRNDGLAASEPGSTPEPSAWVKLILGFGVIPGIPRVTYRRTEARRKGEKSA